MIQLLVFIAAAAGAMLGGAVSVLVGGMGGIRLLNRRVTMLEDDQALLDERVTTEIKRRAGKARHDSRGNDDEMAEVLKALSAASGSAVVPGRDVFINQKLLNANPIVPNAR